jgi:hypothetical protein
MTESVSTGAPASKSGLGAKIGTAIGSAFGWLVLFPIFMGLMGGSIGWFLGLPFEECAIVMGGVAFGFAAFAGIVIVGWKVFINLWPVLLVVGGIAIAVKKLFF